MLTSTTIALDPRAQCYSKVKTGYVIIGRSATDTVTGSGENLENEQHSRCAYKSYTCKGAAFFNNNFAVSARLYIYQ